VKLSDIKINERYALYLENGRGLQPVQVLAIGVPYEGGKHAHGVIVRSEDDRYFIVHYRRITVQWDEWELRQSIAKYEHGKFMESFEWITPGDGPIEPRAVTDDESIRRLRQWFRNADLKPLEPPGEESESPGEESE
jgi:hypothetical protein